MSLLHARGGVSPRRPDHQDLEASSPRPWRCFHGCRLFALSKGVFSTPVEVFLSASLRSPRLPRLLHARGGVSLLGLEFASYGRSSPRPWRCFRSHKPATAHVGVFSTPVEVFPHDTTELEVWLCLLHARGGVSRMTVPNFSQYKSSPRPWRCF